MRRGRKGSGGQAMPKLRGSGESSRGGGGRGGRGGGGREGEQGRGVKIVRVIRGAGMSEEMTAAAGAITDVAVSSTVVSSSYCRRCSSSIRVVVLLAVVRSRLRDLLLVHDARELAAV